ncbi:hypothetical protein ACFL6B_05450, partial [Thermodesulfobacteriota bacterium]
DGFYPLLLKNNQNEINLLKVYGNMKILEWFSRDRRKKAPEDTMRISKIVGPLIDMAAIGIFQTYASELQTESINYIVPAVWGVKEDGELTDTQKEINRKIVHVISDAVNQFDCSEFTKSQKFAIGYFVRELLISKIIYMVSQLKGQSIIEHEYDSIANHMIH